MEEIILKWVNKLLVGLKIIAASVFGRALAGVGLTFAQFQYTLPYVKDFLQGYFNQLPANILQFLGACGVDIFMVVIISAFVAKIGLKVILSTVTAVQGLMGNEGGA